MEGRGICRTDFCQEAQASTGPPNLVNLRGSALHPSLRVRALKTKTYGAGKLEVGNQTDAGCGEQVFIAVWEVLRHQSQRAATGISSALTDAG